MAKRLIALRGDYRRLNVGLADSEALLHAGKMLKQLRAVGGQFQGSLHVELGGCEIALSGRSCRQGAMVVRIGIGREFDGAAGQPDSVIRITH
jgi:hypothetical protein